jgi:non-canonical (house-cleaning) NTP pyrophosphatase
MTDIWVTSTSDIKIAAIREVFSHAPKEFRIVPHQVKCSNPNQPINSACDCATNRVTALQWDPSNPPYLIISIENGIDITATTCQDVCCVVLLDPHGHRCVHGLSDPIPVDRKYYDQAQARSQSTGTSGPPGLSVTIGQMIHQEFPEVPADNWMADPRFGGYHRKDQIKQALERALDQLK